MFFYYKCFRLKKQTVEKYISKFFFLIETQFFVAFDGDRNNLFSGYMLERKRSKNKKLKKYNVELFLKKFDYIELNELISKFELFN